jgi:hypothetical protein
MSRTKRSRLVLGLILVLAGAGLLAFQLVPGLDVWFNVRFEWPLIIVGVGALMLFLGLLFGAPDMAVPAAVIGGIGGLLYWQAVTGRWESWAYVWTLIPGFVGVGMLLAGLFGGNGRSSIREGVRTILVSLILFAIFGSLFGALGFLGDYWPVLLILLGLLFLVQALTRRRS